MPIFINNQQNKIDIDTDRMRRTLKKILCLLGYEDKELSVVLTDDVGIQKLNKQYLDKDAPTNVLAFLMNNGEIGTIYNKMIGDVIVSVETAKKDSLNGNLTLQDEIDYLLIHGILHLLGFEHEQGKDDARAMRKKEKDIFKKIKNYMIV